MSFTYKLSELIVLRILRHLLEEFLGLPWRGKGQLTELLVVGLYDFVDETVGKGLLRRHEVISVAESTGSNLLNGGITVVSRFLIHSNTPIIYTDHDSVAIRRADQNKMTDQPFLPVKILNDTLDSLTRHDGVKLYNIVSNPHNLGSLNANILRLALSTTHRLVNHNTRVRESETSAARAGAKQERGHGCSQTKVDGHDLRADVLNSIVDGQTRNNRTTRAVNIQIDWQIGVLVIKILQSPSIARIIII